MASYTITAEHTQGKSVDHPCTRGVYSDPANDFEVVIAAATEEDAIAEGTRRLGEIVDAAEPCDCQRHLCPGGNAWWGSVAIHAEPRS